MLDGVLDALFLLFHPTLVWLVLDGCWVSQYQNKDNLVVGMCWMDKYPNKWKITNGQVLAKTQALIFFD